MRTPRCPRPEAAGRTGARRPQPPPRAPRWPPRAPAPPPADRHPRPRRRPPGRRAHRPPGHHVSGEEPGQQARQRVDPEVVVIGRTGAHDRDRLGPQRARESLRGPAPRQVVEEALEHAGERGAVHRRAEHQRVERLPPARLAGAVGAAPEAQAAGGRPAGLGAGEHLAHERVRGAALGGAHHAEQDWSAHRITPIARTARCPPGRPLASGHRPRPARAPRSRCGRRPTPSPRRSW